VVFEKGEEPMNEHRGKEKSDLALSIKLMGALGAVTVVSLWLTFGSISRGHYQYIVGVPVSLFLAAYFSCILKSIVDIRRDLDEFISMNEGDNSKKKERDNPTAGRIQDQKERQG
jgi:hypothetical protein